MVYDGISLRFPPHVGTEFVSNIHWHGTKGYEPNVWRILRQLISGSRCFVDVGTNIGFYAVLASLINRQVSIFAFEPVPELYMQAKQMFAANGLTTEGLHQVALSDDAGNALLYLPIDYPTMGSLAGPAPGKQCREVLVTRERMDTFFAHRSISGPVTIKIDVEDHECEVLKGGRQTIAKYRPFIVCELLPRARKNAATLKQIQEMAYAAFAITDAGCFRMHSDDFAEPRNTRDFLLMPAERVGQNRSFIPFEVFGSMAKMSPVGRSARGTMASPSIQPVRPLPHIPGKAGSRR